MQSHATTPPFSSPSHQRQQNIKRNRGKNPFFDQEQLGSTKSCNFSVCFDSIRCKKEVYAWLYCRNRFDGGTKYFSREHDDGDSMMTLLLAASPSNSFVICPDKWSNITRFINGINNHTPDGRKRQNLTCVECHVLLVANRDISKGERLYYDYNGSEHEYPTHHFV